MKLSVTLFCFFLLTAQSVYGDTKFDPRDSCGVPDEYIVLISFSAKPAAAVANDLAVAYEAKVLRSLTIGNYHYFVMGMQEDNARELSQDARVLYVTQDSYGVWEGFECPVFSRPDKYQTFSYSAIDTPLKPTFMAGGISTPSQSKPIGLGTVAEGGSTLSIEVFLPPFSRPVDKYFAIYAPSTKENIWLLANDNTLHLASEGIVKWNENSTTALDQVLAKDIPIDILPAGRYCFYLMVTRPSSMDAYYLWETCFDKW